MTKDYQAGRAPAILFEDDKSQKQGKTLDQLIEECFVEPVVLPEGRVTVLNDSFKYHGNIILPENSKRKPTTAIILRVSDPENMNWLIGRRVVFGTWSGQSLVFKGQGKYRVLECREIIGFINNTDAELVEEVGQE